MYFILILSFCFVCRYYAPVDMLACHYARPWWTFFTYPFYHASFLHLMINSYGLIVYWRFLKVRISPLILLAVSAVSVPLLGMLSAYRPTGGASGILCVFMGIYLSLYPERWRIFALVLTLNLLMSFFFPVNALIHIIGVAYGFGIMRAIRRWTYLLV